MPFAGFTLARTYFSVLKIVAWSKTSTNGKDDGKHAGDNGADLLEDPEHLSPGVGSNHPHRCGVGMQIGVVQFPLEHSLQHLFICCIALDEQLDALAGNHLSPQVGVNQPDRLANFRIVQIRQGIPDKADLLHNCSHVNLLHIGNLLADSVQTLAHFLDVQILQRIQGLLAGADHPWARV